MKSGTIHIGSKAVDKRRTIKLDLMVDASNQPQNLKVTSAPHAAHQSSAKSWSMIIPISSAHWLAEAIDEALKWEMYLTDQQSKKKRSSSINAAGRSFKRRRSKSD